MKRILAAMGVVSLMGLNLLAAPAVKAPVDVPTKPPFPYVKGKAFAILQETHNNQSGYFSLCEGRDGKIYIGTAKYGENSYLVEFDPRTEKQKIVIDVHALCGLKATGYAAQAKIHTRNFVGPSGKIYVGSKEGYREGTNDLSEYPGGYAMVYDPASDRATNLGMPYAGQGLIDIVADEGRGLIYIVTCEDQHWMLYDQTTRQFRELGPIGVMYTTTILDAQGRAHILTRDFQLAVYDPQSDKITLRDILLDGRKLTKEDFNKVPPTWVLGKDGKTAYFLRMNDPTLWAIDISGTGAVKARSLGRLVEGTGCDSRNGLAVGPDGRLYALIRLKNTTHYGQQFFHHLVRFDPRKEKAQDLGVLTVKNPDYFEFKDKKGKPKSWTHGFQTLPDGTLAPLHHHMALIAAHDGTLYATILYPFTLLKIDPIP